MSDSLQQSKQITAGDAGDEGDVFPRSKRENKSYRILYGVEVSPASPASPALTEVPVCGFCTASLPMPANRRLRRVYCSASCRKAAERRRSRDRARSTPSAKTTPTKQLTRDFMAAEAQRLGLAVKEHAETPRPGTRRECPEARPCPWVGCKYHLYLDINPETGSIKINFPDREPHELKHSCSLDAADLGGLILEEVADRMNLTRERIRQLESRALLVLRRAGRGLR